MGTKALDAFGALLMRRVRDQAILEMQRRAHRKMMGSLSASELDEVKRFVPLVVDEVLHHMLWTIKQEEEITLLFKDEAGVDQNLREASVDGLEGELYDWVDRYSSYPRSD